MLGRGREEERTKSRGELIKGDRMDSYWLIIDVVITQVCEYSHTTHKSCVGHSLVLTPTTHRRSIVLKAWLKFTGRRELYATRQHTIALPLESILLVSPLYTDGRCGNQGGKKTIQPRYRP